LIATFVSAASQRETIVLPIPELAPVTSAVGFHGRPQSFAKKADAKDADADTNLNPFLYK